jgi:sugar phosphate isomerase/epimerase
MKNKILVVTLAALAAFSFLSVARATDIPEECKIGPFAVSVQAWSFNRFSFFEAIEKTEKTGAKCIEMFPGQKLSKDEPTVKWDHNASDELIAKVKAKLAEHKITAVNYGVVGVPADEAGARKVFEFAKKMGLYGITTESTGSIEVLDKLAKEYDIRVCFHDHPKRDKDPLYRMWDPNYILEVCKGRDARVGSCADTGHWQTSGLKPVDCVKQLAGHVMSSHLKDRADFGKGGPDIIFGTGIGQVAEVLAEFKTQGLKGNISIEYENNWNDNVPDITKCVEFIKDWVAKNK